MGEKLLFHGAASEVITPFTKSGDIEYNLLAGEIEHLIQNGITGIFVNGLASEALMFSTEDRVKVAKKCVDVAAGRIPVVGNIIYNSIDLAIECVRGYEACGCDAIIMTPPLVYKYTEAGMFQYFADIAKSTTLPVYLYNAPETGNKVSPEIIGKLFAEIPNMRGYKDSTQDIIHQQTVLSLIGDKRHFELLSGSDAQILSTSMLGGVGVFSLLTCVFPKLIVDICNAIDAQDWETAKTMQWKILEVRQALKVGPFMAAYKYVGQLIGVPLGSMKAPLTELNEAEQKKVVAMLTELDMLPGK